MLLRKLRFLFHDEYEQEVNLINLRKIQALNLSPQKIRTRA